MEGVALTAESPWHNCGVDERGLVMNSRSHGDRIKLEKRLTADTGYMAE